MDGWMAGGPFSGTSIKKLSMVRERWLWVSCRYLTTHLVRWKDTLLQVLVVDRFQF
jgi:hypothetical protein